MGPFVISGQASRQQRARARKAQPVTTAEGLMQ